MYKEIPVQSRLIEKRLVQAENDRRRNVIGKIMNAPVQQKSRSVSTAPNAITRFAGKNQIAYMRHVEIETVNRKLLEKMSKIMQSDYQSSIKEARVNPPKQMKSLNEPKKKQIQQRIVTENEMMLSRLVKGKSSFSVTKWEQSHQKRQKLLQRFGVHPYVLNQKSTSIDENLPNQSQSGRWQSSTRIGVEDNINKFNLPLAVNEGRTGFSSTSQNFSLPTKIRSSLNNDRLMSKLTSNQSGQQSPLGTSSMHQSRYKTVDRSFLHEKNLSPSPGVDRRRFMHGGGLSNYQNREPSIMSQKTILNSLSPRSTAKKLHESTIVVDRQASVLNENRIVLYKKGKRMGKGYYIIEISSCQEKMFITAFNVEKPQSLILEIPESKARYILEHYDHDIEQMASCLTVSSNHKKLILLNPHHVNQSRQDSISLNHKNDTSSRFNTINFQSSNGMIAAGDLTSELDQALAQNEDYKDFYKSNESIDNSYEVGSVFNQQEIDTFQQQDSLPRPRQSLPNTNKQLLEGHSYYQTTYDSKPWRINQKRGKSVISTEFMNQNYANSNANGLDQIGVKPRTTSLRKRTMAINRNEGYGLNAAVDSDQRDSMLASVQFDEIPTQHMTQSQYEESVKDRAQSYYHSNQQQSIPVKVFLPKKKTKKSSTRQYKTLQNSMSPKSRKTNINWQNTENNIKLKDRQPDEMGNNTTNFFNPNSTIVETKMVSNRKLRKSTASVPKKDDKQDNSPTYKTAISIGANSKVKMDVKGKLKNKDTKTTSKIPTRTFRMPFKDQKNKKKLQEENKDQKTGVSARGDVTEKQQLSAGSIKDITIITTNMAKGVENDFETHEAAVEPGTRESDEDSRPVTKNDAGVPQDLVTSEHQQQPTPSKGEKPLSSVATEEQSVKELLQEVYEFALEDDQSQLREEQEQLEHHEQKQRLTTINSPDEYTLISDSAMTPNNDQLIVLNNDKAGSLDSGDGMNDFVMSPDKQSEQEREQRPLLSSSLIDYNQNKVQAEEQSPERPPRREAVDSEEEDEYSDDEFQENTNRSASGRNELITFDGASQPVSANIPPQTAQNSYLDDDLSQNNKINSAAGGGQIMPAASDILSNQNLNDVLDKVSDEDGTNENMDDSYMEDQFKQENDGEENDSEVEDTVAQIAMKDTQKQESLEYAGQTVSVAPDKSQVGFFANGKEIPSGTNSSDYNSYSEALEDDEYKSEGFNEVEDGIDAQDENKSSSQNRALDQMEIQGNHVMGEQIEDVAVLGSDLPLNSTPLYSNREEDNQLKNQDVEQNQAMDKEEQYTEGTVIDVVNERAMIESAGTQNKRLSSENGTINDSVVTQQIQNKRGSQQIEAKDAKIAYVGERSIQSQHKTNFNLDNTRLRSNLLSQEERNDQQSQLLLTEQPATLSDRIGKQQDIYRATETMVSEEPREYSYNLGEDSESPRYSTPGREEPNFEHKSQKSVVAPKQIAKTEQPVSAALKESIIEPMAIQARTVVTIEQPEEVKLVGVLKLNIIEAKLFRDTDTWGKMDPWIQIQTSCNQEVRTRELEGAGQDPKWDETFDLTVQNLKDDTIKMTCWDQDFGGSKDHIGFREFKMSQLYDIQGQMPIDAWIMIHHENKDAGKVHLSASWQPAV